MIVRTLVPSASAPDGSATTVPTASMPLIGVASGHSPLRMCVSAWLTPNALTRISTSPSPGTGSGTSWICRTSGPPGLVMTIARILASSPPAANRRCLVIVQKLTPKRGGPQAAVDAPSGQ